MAPWLARLHALWALLAERPCHMLVESGGSGGAHAYWKIAKPLAATRVVKATGELVEPVERANLRLVHRRASVPTASRTSPTRRAPSVRE